MLNRFLIIEGASHFSPVRINNNYSENNKFLYFEQAKKDVKKYNEFYDSTHTALKDLSIGDVSYTILINKNL